MFGVFLDVTPRKQAEEAREMLAAEMSHRVKNLFAIAAALTAIAARSAATTTEMARDLTQRLTALGRAHDLVRPIPGQEERRAALFGDLLLPCSRPTTTGARLATASRLRARDACRRNLGDDACPGGPRAGDQLDQVWGALGRRAAVHWCLPRGGHERNSH